VKRRARLWPAVAVFLLLGVSACSSPEKEARCEEAFTSVTTSVDGVAAAEWDCNFQFGGGWVRSDVVLEPATEEEAIAVVEAVLRALAASPDLEDGWSTPQEYTVEDSSIIVSSRDVGFTGGVPNVGDVRAEWGITPG
jgi:hypothetical protein